MESPFPESMLAWVQTPGFIFWLGSIAAFVAAIGVVIVLAFRGLRRAKYEKPRIVIEALGPARGLTAVEAAVLLDLKPVKVLK